MVAGRVATLLSLIRTDAHVEMEDNANEGQEQEVEPGRSGEGQQMEVEQLVETPH